MPKGKKTCPECGLETGARATECQCGHQFSRPIKNDSKKVESTSPSPTPSPSQTPPAPSIKSSIQSPLIYGPAGKCPCKPEGYEKDWPNGKASEEVVVDWIFRVLNYNSSKNYSPRAIIYWAGQFWDINGPNMGEDYKRVRSIIVNTLVVDETAKLEFLF
jgi:hypothetical protein